ncbi:hypothetical protein KDX31_15715 [Amphritea atlantica]|uniref:Flagellar protein FliT n=1 Tax=Amphritea atlantica TaxID=355243 RepID=A0ABY5GU32_9GAMM|nr:hypothetical protein KDX31_15715 [Amphritea atlantica]
MPQLSPAALKWRQEFSEIERLQQAIFAALRTTLNEEGDDELPLSDLIKQQDSLIRQLPFSQLNADDVEQLKDKIALLQQNHQTLITAISNRRQTLLDQSSQSKKAGRSIKAYQKAQDL